MTGTRTAPPRLRQGLVALRRDRTTWQIGLDPARAALVRGVDAALAAGLRALDRAHYPDADPAQAARLEPRLLAQLLAHGLLAPQPAARPVRERHVRRRAQRRGDNALAELCGLSDPVTRRQRACVAVSGTGPVAALVALGLAHAGVHTVALLGRRRPLDLTDLVPGGPGPRDVGTPWVDSVAASLRALGSATTLVEARRPDVVVLTEVADADLPWCDPDHGERWLRSGVPHLAATAAGSGDVGPVVVPGRTGCLHCRDLARADADAAWPALVAGLRDLPAADVPVALGAPLTAVTAALAVARAVAYVDGATDPVPERGLLLDATGIVVGHYPLVAHPRCGCTWDPAAVTMVG